MVRGCEKSGNEIVFFNRPNPTLLSSDLISEANTFAVNEKVYGGLIELRNEL